MEGDLQFDHHNCTFRTFYPIFPQEPAVLVWLLFPRNLHSINSQSPWCCAFSAAIQAQLFLNNSLHTLTMNTHTMKYIYISIFCVHRFLLSFSLQSTGSSNKRILPFAFFLTSHNTWLNRQACLYSIVQVRPTQIFEPAEASFQTHQQLECSIKNNNL